MSDGFPTAYAVHPQSVIANSASRPTATATLLTATMCMEEAGIVREVTDDKSLPKAGRKRLQVELAGHKSREAKLIKLADKTSNLRAIANSPPPDWSVQRRLEYVRWAREVVAQVRGTSPWLEQQFDEAANQAEQSGTKS
jgi:hypothetical protein